MQARQLRWSMPVKSSTGGCLSYAIVKVSFNCWERTLNKAVIKFLQNDTFETNFTISATEIVLKYNCSLTTLFLNKKWKWKHGILWHLHIIHKSPLLKTRESIFLLFGSWSIVFISMFELSQSFSDISILPILVDVQRFHENGKWIVCVDKSKWLCVRLRTKSLQNGFLLQ